MGTSTQFRLRRGLLLSNNQGARFLTDVRSGKVYELNETAAQVVQAVQKGAGLAVVVEALSRHYPVIPLQEIEGDAQELLQDMLARKLLEVAPNP